MKYYLKIAGGMVFFIANYYAVKLIFAAMDYPSDLTFFAGLFGLALLATSDGLIAVRVLRKYMQDYLPKSEDAGDKSSSPESKEEP